MSLLQWENFEGTEDCEDAVWVQRTVRWLVPRDTLPGGYDQDAWTVNFVSSALMGEPAKCECGTVAIRYGEQYTWGRDKYGRRDDNHRKRGQYCPHCDGGEDM